MVSLKYHRSFVRLLPPPSRLLRGCSERVWSRPAWLQCCTLKRTLFYGSSEGSVGLSMQWMILLYALNAAIGHLSSSQGEQSRKLHPLGNMKSRRATELQRFGPTERVEMNQPRLGVLSNSAKTRRVQRSCAACNSGSSSFGVLVRNTVQERE